MRNFSTTMTESEKPAIIWFRQDLRLADNPALVHAAQTGKPLIALFVLDELSPGIRTHGAAQKWWLHHSVQSLADDLKSRDIPLILRRGAAADIVQEIVEESGADLVVWNRRYGEAEQAVDRAVKSSLREEGLAAESFGGLLMHEPKKVRTGKGDPYKVYTPFWKKFQAECDPRKPHPVPEKFGRFRGDLDSDRLSEWKLLPEKPDWSGGIEEAWVPGEKAANEQAGRFFSDDLDDYESARDRPGQDRTARLSPHLRFGEISPYQLWHAALDGRRSASESARITWLKELVWREFSYHLLQEWPHLAEANFKPKYDLFPWREDEEALKAWQKGQTGYPIVDAGMRQLWITGWMHNRVRMIAASFLIKHLLVDWRHGERWFWDTLVDGDPASNPAQWQWVAGSGADASPFFRIFNPITQAKKFDPKGIYIRHFVPELADLPDDYLPAPWEAPEDVLEKAGVSLGKTYPKPIVDHEHARGRALEALDQLKRQNRDE